MTQKEAEKTGLVRVEHVLLSQSDGAFVAAVTECMNRRAMPVLHAAKTPKVPDDVAALILDELVPALMVFADPAQAVDALPDAKTIARMEKLIAAAVKKDVGRIVLISTSAQSRAHPDAVVSAAKQIEEVLQKTAGDRAVILRASDVIDPHSDGSQAAVAALKDGGLGKWPVGGLFQGVALGDLAQAASAAALVRDVGGKSFEIAIDTAASVGTMQQETGRLFTLLTDPMQVEVTARPSYPATPAPKDAVAAHRALHVRPETSVWTMLAETVQQVVKNAGTYDLTPPMPAVKRALETGALPLVGAQVVVTGATGAIGRELVERLVRLGATVIGVARDKAAGEALVKTIAEARETMSILRKRRQRIAVESGQLSAADADSGPIGTFAFEAADLTDHDQIRALAKRLEAAMPRIDGLIHCAGQVTVTRSETADGIEATLAANLVAPVTLTRLLAGPLTVAGKAHGAKVVNVVSEGYAEAPFDINDPHSNWTYAPDFVLSRVHSGLIMMTQAFAEVMKTSGVSIVAVSPGEVRSALRDAMIAPRVEGIDNNQQRLTRERQIRAQMNTPAQGAEHVLEVLMADDLVAGNGVYIEEDAIAPFAPHVTDRAAMEAVWALCAELGKLAP